MVSKTYIDCKENSIYVISFNCVIYHSQNKKRHLPNFFKKIRPYKGMKYNL